MHTTTGGYVDTIDFNVKNKQAGPMTTVRLFSISNIHGALGDNGQSFKNIKYLIDHTLPDASPNLKIVHGCGQKSGVVAA